MNRKIVADSSREILFEKFEIIEYIKKDQHYGVYLANHIYLGKKIILKTLNTKTIPDETIIKRFQREAKILAKLDNPNIIKVLDFGTFEKFFYISFEYFPGENLRTAIDKGKLENNTKLNITIQLLKGLSFAHQNGIIHRDIKPENILLNSNYDLKIGDFGLALSSGDDLITNQYSIVGTPCYMSPEQVQGEKLTTKTDLFSAGIVIYELFLGKNPFLGKKVNDSINQIINYKENDITKSLSVQDENLKFLLTSLLKRSPEERFNSADEVLEYLVNGSEIIAEDESSSQKGTKMITVISGIIFITLMVITSWYIISKMNQPIENEMKTPDIYLTENTKDSLENTDSSNLEKSIPSKEIESANIPLENRANTNHASRLIPEVNNKEPEVAYGFITVDSKPWADVYIDGRKLDTTPLVEKIRLESGTYYITLTHPEFPEYKKQIEVVADSILDIRVNLDTLFAYLNCNALPWGKIYINNEFKGESPINLKLIPGKYQLTLANPQYKNWDTTIILRQNKRLIINHKFTNK